MNKKGYTTIELLIFLGVFTVIYFTTTVIVSKNFQGDYVDKLYDEKIAAIEKQASIYGENTKDFFKENDSVYMTIEELALANVIISNEEGKVTDPRNKEKSLSDLRVKISKEDDKVTAKVLS